MTLAESGDYRRIEGIPVAGWALGMKHAISVRRTVQDVLLQWQIEKQRYEQFYENHIDSIITDDSALLAQFADIRDQMESLLEEAASIGCTSRYDARVLYLAALYHRGIDHNGESPTDRAFADVLRFL